MEVVLEVLHTFEKSDHDGYCSGGENEYSYYEDTRLYTKRLTQKNVDNNPFIKSLLVEHEHTYDIMDKLETLLFSDNIYKVIREYEYEEYPSGGSMYCDISKESGEHDMGKHELRATRKLISYKIEIVK